MITLQNVTLRRGRTVLLEALDVTIYQKQHIGIIGANGSGKSSLFALLLGELTADQGDITLPTQLRIAHLAQETPALQQSALDFVLDGDPELRALEAALTDAEEKNDGTRMANLHEKMSVIDAYTAPARAGQLLAGLGFSGSEQQKSVSDFSGGFRIRLNLAKALMCRSDLLLLDEPTNHLDLDAVLWFEGFLKKYQGTLILISHDRDFLDATVDHIAHIAERHLKLYSGNYSSFEKQRASELLMQQATYEKQQRQLAHLQSFVDRFRAKASKARQAQSRLKAIARMDLVCALQTESPFQFKFRIPKDCPYPLLQLEEASVAYGKEKILQQLNLSIVPRERIAILGPNGAGKSSLIKLLAGELTTPDGKREASPGLKMGYFAQHQVDHLQMNESPLQHMRDRATHEKELELRQFLGGFGFVGDAVFAPVSQFSGGEKARLALALLVWLKPNLLLLDEPTNHLDLEMRNALSIALQEYEGAMIMVTHDRFLVRTTTDQLLLVANGKLQTFEGDLDDYQRWLFDFRKQPSAVVEKNKPAQKNKSTKVITQKIQKLEDELLRLEKELASIEVHLADSKLYDPENKTMLQQQLSGQAAVKKSLEQVEKQWLSACEERDH